MTPLRVYDNCVDSGLAWLSQIPSHWQLRPLGSCFIERRETVSDKQFLPLSVTMSGIIPQLENAAKTDNGDNRKRVVKGDFVINSRSDRKGSAGLSDLDGSVSLISTVLTPRADLHPRFIHYLLRSRPFQEEYYRFGTGIVADLWSTRYSSMKRILLPIPPWQEQQWIASFLDSETAHVDKLIAKQQALIELLSEKRQAIITQAVTKGLDPSAPTKPSGIPWLGDIPSHWDTPPISASTVLVQTGPFGSQIHSEDYINGGTPLINPSHLIDGRIVPSAAVTVGDEKATELNRHALRKGDIVVARRGDLGRNAVVDDISAGSLCGTGSLLLRFEKSTYVPEFFSLVFDSQHTRDRLNLSSIGATMNNLNASLVSRLRLVRPPFSEQRHILSKLTNLTADPDVTRQKVERAITLLKERRSALISAAVTGKIDVREGAA